MSKAKYDVISPDGFSISRDKKFSSVKSARKNLNEWIERYKIQGYYSSSQYGRIALTDLDKYCSIIIVN